MGTKRPEPATKLDIDQMSQVGTRPTSPPPPRKEPEQSAPVTRPPVSEPIQMTPANTQPKQFNIQSAIIGLFAGVVLCFLFMGSDGSGPTPGPNPGPSPTPSPVIDVTVDKPTVLVKWDEKMEASDGQWDVVNSTKFQTWCEEKGYVYRRYDKDDDMIRVEPIYGKLMEVAADVPSLTVASTDGTITMSLPDTVEGCQKATSDHVGK